MRIGWGSQLAFRDGIGLTSPFPWHRSCWWELEAPRTVIPVLHSGTQRGILPIAAIRGLIIMAFLYAILLIVLVMALVYQTFVLLGALIRLAFYLLWMCCLVLWLPIAGCIDLYNHRKARKQLDDDVITLIRNRKGVYVPRR
jgi:hypothetical protein